MTGVALRFFGCTAAMPLAAWLLPGVHAAEMAQAWMAGLLLALLYLLLRPLLKLLLSPFNCLTFGLVGLLLDAGSVLLADRWMDGFAVDGFLWALAASLMSNFLREGAGMLAGKKR